MSAETSNARGDLLRPKLENIISGHRINADDADWLRGLLAAAPPPAAARGDVRGLVALAERVQYADTHAQVSKDDAGEFVCLPPWLWLEIRDAAVEALAAEGVQAGEPPADAEVRGVVDEVRRVAHEMRIRSLDGATRSALLYSDDMRTYADRLAALTEARNV